jgi:hypothetical protein
MASANAQAILAQIPNDFYGGEICTSVGTLHNIHVLQYVDHQYSMNACVTVDTQGTSGSILKDRWYDPFRRSSNYGPTTIGFQWRRDLHERQNCAQHTRDTSCGLDTQWTCGSILKDRWYGECRCSSDSCPNTIGFQWKRDLHEHRNCAQQRDVIMKQFLPAHHKISMEERIVALSLSLLSDYFQIWKKT